MTTTSLQALAIPRVLHLASVRALANSRASPSITATLSPTDLLGATRVAGSGSGSRPGSRGRGGGDGLKGGGDATGGGLGSLGSEDGADGRPCGLLAEVGVVQEGVALAGERLRDPRVLVGEAPDGDADAAGDVQAGADDVGEVVTLGDEGGGGGRERRVADVELGIGDFDVESGEALEHGGERRARRRAADDQVRLETDTVDGGAGGLDDLDDLDGTVGLGLVVLEVVVVVVAKVEAVSLAVIRNLRRKKTHSLVLGSAALAALKAMAK